MRMIVQTGIGLNGTEDKPTALTTSASMNTLRGEHVVNDTADIETSSDIEIEGFRRVKDMFIQMAEKLLWQRVRLSFSLSDISAEMLVDFSMAQYGVYNIVIGKSFAAAWENGTHDLSGVVHELLHIALYDFSRLANDKSKDGKKGEDEELVHQEELFVTNLADKIAAIIEE